MAAMGTPNARKPGRPRSPRTPFEQADVNVAKQLRRWEGWEGARHFAEAAFWLSQRLAFEYVSTIDDPAFMGFRNVFRSYCNLWRRRHVSENWEVADAATMEQTAPTVESQNAAFSAIGFTSLPELVNHFAAGGIRSFVTPERKSRAGKLIPVKLVLGVGPGDDPRGYGRKPLPVRYADALEQDDIRACMLIDTLLSGQLAALRMDRLKEDADTARGMHEMLTVFHMVCQLFGVRNFDWSGWCWHPDFNYIAYDLDCLKQPNSLCGKFSSNRADYALMAYFRLRREAGGHNGLQAAGYPSLLYCEDRDCPTPLFCWPGPKAGIKGKPKVPHLCPNHDPGQAAAWRKRRERTRKRAERESRKT